MTMHAYWRHLPSNELWAVTLQRGAIVGACGPLNEVDMTGGVLRHLPYSVPLGAWVNQNRPHFEPASAPEPMPQPERPDDIEHALMQGETCLRCIALSSHAPLRHVVDELRRLSRNAEVIIGEDTCRSCRQHRAIFTVTNVAGCVGCTH